MKKSLFLFWATISFATSQAPLGFKQPAVINWTCALNSRFCSEAHALQHRPGQVQ